MGGERRFALIAGEASGDLLGADLIRRLTERFPGARFAGIGGPSMVAAGLDAWADADELAVMGLAEVLSHLPRLLALRRRMADRIEEWRPDCVIGIDAPDFNLGLERRLKERGLRTIHYVSPSVWAWREKRIRSIGRSADRVLALFPFEPALYQDHGVDARFVGHPLARAFPHTPKSESYRRALDLPLEGQLLAVLPGSRRGEVRRIGPAMAQTMARLARPDLAFVAPAARLATGEDFRQQVAQWAPQAKVHWIEGQSREAMMAADAVLLASGTAALEAMLAKRPMVVAYRIAVLTYWIVKGFGLMKTPWYSLPNKLAGEALVPEILQGAMTPDALAAAVAPLLDDPAAAERQTARFAELHASLEAPESALADAVAGVIGAPSPCA